jgi:hypothetical protein
LDAAVRARSKAVFGRRHALADIQRHDAHGIAVEPVGNQRAFTPLRPRDGQGDEQDRQSSQGQDQEVSQNMTRPALMNRFAQKTQRGKRHERGTRPRQ